MKGVFTVDENLRLVPSDKTAGKMRDLLAVGVEIEAKLDIEKPRSLPQHCRYWARLSEIVNTLPEHFLKNFYAHLFADLVNHTTIDVILLHEIVKRRLDVKSIAFQKMDQSAASAFFKKADEFFEGLLFQLWGVE